MKEIILLNYGMMSPELVAVKTEALIATIAEAMDDWGLVPNAEENAS